MQRTQFIFTIFLSLLSLISYSQESLIGTWKTIDDVTGDAKSHIEIYQDNGAFCGKIKSLLQRDPDTVCESCKGVKKDQPLVGMVIMEGLIPHKNYWSNGTIMDPENGKTYKCKIYLESPDKLKVRGYIGIEALGRNQYWTRLEQ